MINGACSATRIPVRCAGVLAGLALAASPALARSASKPLASTTTQSAYFGGYDIRAPSEGLTSNSSTFKLPKITCPNASNSSESLYLGEFVNNATGGFFQPGGGTDAIAIADLECNAGDPSYVIVAQTFSNGSYNDVTASQGDLIETRVEETSAGQAVATVNDITSGQSVTAQGASNGDDAQVLYEGASPDTDQEQNNGNDDIPKFTSVAFTDSQVNGLSLAESDPTRTQLEQDKSLQISPGALTSGHATGFTLTEKSDK